MLASVLSAVWKIKSWTWVFVCVAIILLVGWLGLSSLKANRRAKLRGRVLRTALDAHPETVLVCLRAVYDDVPQVARCVANACRQAASPMRLRFAIVQDQTSEDVYAALENIVRQPSSLFNDFDLLSHVRTTSVMRSSFLHAAGTWLAMHDEETVVVCADAWVEWEAGWDIALVQAMSSEAANAVLSAPAGGQYCAIMRGEAYALDNNGEAADDIEEEDGKVLVSWPAVIGRPFAYNTDKVTDAVAVHHHFFAMHGLHFASLPAPTVQVPLHLVDVVLSDWLVAAGSSSLRTLPHGIFTRPVPPPAIDDHLRRQIPASWDGQLRLSAQFLDRAGLARVGRRDGQNRTDKQREHPRRQERLRERVVVAHPFVVTVRAQLGLTASAAHTNETALKYGSRRAEQQQRDALRAAMV